MWKDVGKERQRANVKTAAMGRRGQGGMRWEVRGGGRGRVKLGRDRMAEKRGLLDFTSNTND